VELKGLGTPCSLIDKFQSGLRRQVISSAETAPFRCGALGVVRAGGQVAAGDHARVVLPNGPRLALPRL
jgi:MOSC domain-containing protein YiiM